MVTPCIPPTHVRFSLATGRLETCMTKLEMFQHEFHMQPWRLPAQGSVFLRQTAAEVNGKAQAQLVTISPDAGLSGGGIRFRKKGKKINKYKSLQVNILNMWRLKKNSLFQGKKKISTHLREIYEKQNHNILLIFTR